ncbi:MAG: fibrillarin-like rRNA/tRNA 2'-O-methyltransferase [Candidatus Aenigmatarchaeota archaeon]
MNEVFNNVVNKQGKFYTVNLDPGNKVYGEGLIKEDKELRSWDPNRSKLAAALKKDLGNFPLEKGTKVLYLGAAQGTTPSHISDIIEEEGIAYLVEFSERAVRDLLKVCERRSNMVPVLADARKPEQYDWVEKVDVVYQDVAQPDQVEILKRNAKEFLKKKGWIMLAVKARATDVTEDPESIYEDVKSNLREDFEIKEFLRLDPFEDDHCFIVAQKS